jgi:hypothetical protein
MHYPTPNSDDTDNDYPPRIGMPAAEQDPEQLQFCFQPLNPFLSDPL